MTPQRSNHDAPFTQAEQTAAVEKYITFVNAEVAAGAAVLTRDAELVDDEDDDEP